MRMYLTLIVVLLSAKLTEQAQGSTQVHSELAVFTLAEALLNPSLADAYLVSISIQRVIVRSSFSMCSVEGGRR
jgi:hypothetical protein